MAPKDPRARRTGILVVLALFSVAIAQTCQRLPSEEPIDFYHFWGIQAARSLSSETLESPYSDPKSYAAFLNETAERSADDSLRRTNARRRELDPTATPALYAFFAWLPDDFRAARRLFVGLQLACVAAGTALLGRSFGLASRPAWTLAAAVTLTFGPFLSDVKVGNVNALQLAGMALALRLSTSSRPAGRAAMALALVLILFKPNQAPAAALLAVARGVRVGARRAVGELGIGLAAAGAFAALAGLWFGSFEVFRDWYEFLYGADPDKMPGYPIERGMFASPVLLARWWGGDPYAYSLGLFALVAAAFGAACAAARARGRELRELLGDPVLLASLGVVASFAAAPLAWYHYYVLALVPGLYVFLAGARVDAAAALGAIALGTYWGPLAVVPWAGGHLTELISFAWLPLLAALCLRAAESARRPAGVKGYNPPEPCGSLPS